MDGRRIEATFHSKNSFKYFYIFTLNTYIFGFYSQNYFYSISSRAIGSSTWEKETYLILHAGCVIREKNINTEKV